MKPKSKISSITIVAYVMIATAIIVLVYNFLIVGRSQEENQDEFVSQDSKIQTHDSEDIEKEVDQSDDVYTFIIEMSTGEDVIICLNAGDAKLDIVQDNLNINVIYNHVYYDLSYSIGRMSMNSIESMSFVQGTTTVLPPYDDNSVPFKIAFKNIQSSSNTAVFEVTFTENPSYESIFNIDDYLGRYGYYHTFQMEPDPNNIHTIYKDGKRTMIRSTNRRIPIGELEKIHYRTYRHCFSIDAHGNQCVIVSFNTDPYKNYKYMHLSWDISDGHGRLFYGLN